MAVTVMSGLAEARTSVNINNCTNLNGTDTDYNLTANVFFTATYKPCFNMSANTTLNGNGFNITGTQESYAINMTTYNNVSNINLYNTTGIIVYGNYSRIDNYYSNTNMSNSRSIIVDLNAQYNYFNNITSARTQLHGILIYGDFNIINNSNIHDTGYQNNAVSALEILQFYNTTGGNIVSNTIIDGSNDVASAIMLYQSAANRVGQNNTLYNNTITGRRLFNIYNNFSKDNMIYNNTFNISGPFNVTNMLQSFNNFNNGTIGNTWLLWNGSGYSQTCTDANSDGICDSPYVILGVNSTDYYPRSLAAPAPPKKASTVKFSLLSKLRFSIGKKLTLWK